MNLTQAEWLRKFIEDSEARSAALALRVEAMQRENRRATVRLGVLILLQVATIATYVWCVR